MQETSKYFSVNEYNNLCKKNDKYLSIISYNIRSFHANQDTFFGIFQTDFSLPDVLVFCETWFTNDYLIYIPVYQAFHTIRSRSRSGGVSIYVRDSISCGYIKDLCFANETVEICSIYLTMNECKYYIIGIYRPHSDTISNFVDALEPILNHAIIKDKNCIKLWDLNINILDSTTAHKNFITFLQSLLFLSCISKATRFPSSNAETPSLLDHIWILN